MTSAAINSTERAATHRLVIYTKYASLAIAIYWVLLWMGVL